MKKRKILITGGAGFIGSNLVADQLAKGHDVWAVDNFATGNRANLASSREHPSFRFDEADVASWSTLPEAVAWADRIFHMAATVGQKFVLQQPLLTITNNIASCQAVLEAMAAKKAHAFLLIASTSELYCRSLSNPDGTLSETALITLGGRSFQQETYPVAKLSNELMGLSYAYERGIQCTIARLFNTVGTHQTPAYGMVLPTFLKQALSGAPVTVYGDGLQSRAFIDVRDTVTALDLLLDHPESSGEIFNVGSHQEYRILDLAQLVIAQTKSSSPIQHLSYEEAYRLPFVDVQRRLPNLRKIQALTAFSPKYTLEDTIDSILRKEVKR